MLAQTINRKATIVAVVVVLLTTIITLIGWRNYTLAQSGPLVQQYTMSPDYVGTGLKIKSPPLGMKDLSGITYNAEADSFMVANNKRTGDGSAYLLDYDADALVVNPLTTDQQRLINISILSNVPEELDIEGITFMGRVGTGTPAVYQYGIIDEETATIYVINVPDSIADYALTTNDLVHTIETEIEDAGDADDENNNGLEGIAYKQYSTYPVADDLLTFYSVREGQDDEDNNIYTEPELYQITFEPDTSTTTVISLGSYNWDGGTGDAAGVYTSPWSEDIFIISEKARKVYQVDANGTQIGSVDIDTATGGAFNNPEGITFDTNMEYMYIIGEKGTPEFAVYELPNTTTWTNWLDRDNPGGRGAWAGDWELRSDHSVCQSPIGVKAGIRESNGGTPGKPGTISVEVIAPQQSFDPINYFVPGFDASSVSEIGYFDKLTPEDGLYCVDNRHPNGRCPDYEIQFLCMEE